MKILIFLLLSFFGFSNFSEKDGIQTGGKIENFTLTNAISNQPVSLSNYASEKGVVLIFTSNYCPYSKLYEDRIIALSNQFESQGVKFMLINSNTSADNIDDTIEEMAKHARKKGLQMPYLADKEHILSNQLGATKTPEAFVLQNTGNGVFILKYRGAIDDNPQVPDVVSAFYLKDAVTAIINKKNLSLMEKRPIGCMIKKE